MDKNCRTCRSLLEGHYEKEGAKPYIKYSCGNKFGLNSDYQVYPDQDYCSKWEARPAPELAVGDEVECHGIRGVLVRDPYEVGTIEKTTLCQIWYGTHMSSTNIHEVTPTGRHFPEVGNLIQALREGEEK